MDVAFEINKGKEIVSNLPSFYDSVLVGSAAYLNNPKDIDFLILLYPNDDLMDYEGRLLDQGWDSCGNLDYLGMGSTWTSVRKGNINLIITTDPQFFNGYKTATEVCKALRLESKTDRIAVHYIVRDGATADEVQVNNVQVLDNTFNLR